jgi:hypothetical protein
MSGYALDQLTAIIFKKEVEIAVLKANLAQLHRSELGLRMMVEDELPEITDERKRQLAIHNELLATQSYTDVQNAIRKKTLELGLAQAQLNFLKNTFEVERLKLKNNE